MSEGPVIVLKSIDCHCLKMRIMLSDSGNDPLISVSSQCCDPITDIGESLLKINSLYDTDGRLPDKPKTLYSFWEEAASLMHNCSFTPLPQRVVAVEFSLSSDINSGIHVKQEFDSHMEVGLDRLIANLYEEMKKLLITHGFSGFREHWGKGFPVAMFIKLHDLARHKKLVSSSFLSEVDALRTIIESEA